MDLRDPRDPPDPPATVSLESLVPRVALENQATLVRLVKEVPLVQPDKWDQEVHLVPPEALDLLDCPLLENLDQLDSLGLQAQEESLV